MKDPPVDLKFSSNSLDLINIFLMIFRLFLITSPVCGGSSNVTQFPAQVYRENEMVWHRSFGAFRAKEHLHYVSIPDYWSQNMRLCLKH